MDKKFYLTSSGLICPKCKSDDIRILGKSEYTGNTNIVKCGNCGLIFMEDELEEKEENET